MRDKIQEAAVLQLNEDLGRIVENSKTSPDLFIFEFQLKLAITNFKLAVMQPVNNSKIGGVIPASQKGEIVHVNEKGSVIDTGSELIFKIPHLKEGNVVIRVDPGRP